VVAVLVNSCEKKQTPRTQQTSITTNAEQCMQCIFVLRLPEQVPEMVPTEWAAHVGGVQVTAKGEQAHVSVAVPVNDTAAPQLLALTKVGQFTTGGVVSCTVTGKEHSAQPTAASFTSQLTVVTP
jgi:hypothetical protein